MHYAAGEQTWRLSNGVVEAVFDLSPEGYFEFRSFRHLHNGDEWKAPSSFRASPIQFRAGNTTYDAYTQFRLIRQSATAIPRRGYQQIIELEDAARLGRVTVELELFENQPVLRHRVRFQNIGPSPVKVDHVDLLPWSFEDGNSSYRFFRVNQWAGAGKLANFEPLEDRLDPQGAMVQMWTGAHGIQCAWLALRDNANRGLFAGWEFDGKVTAGVRNPARYDYLQLSAAIAEISRPLASGQGHWLPAAFLGLFHGDWDEAGWRTQRFAEAAIARPIPDTQFPYVIWDSWKYGTEIDEATLRRNAEIAARIGIEVFVVDLGWARQIGEWQPDPRKFPNGLRPLSDYVHSLGMKFGLHFPLAEAMDSSPVLRANPDWKSTEQAEYFGARSLCLSHQPARQWIIGEAIRLIDEYGVDWILQDGENMVKSCTRSTHTHDPGDSNYSNAVDGINAVVATVQARRPRVIWENCEDGGNMMTFNMLRRYTTSIAADDSGPLTTRQAVYGITYPFPNRYADRYMPEEELTPYITRSYMFGGPWIFMNRLAQMKPQDLGVAASEIRLYKSFRQQVRQGRVYHLSRRPAEDRTDAIMSYHQASNSAVVFVNRPNSAPPSTIRLRGLHMDNNYLVTFQEDSRLMTMTGEQLMRTGIEMSMPQRYSSEIIFVDPQ